VHHFPVAGCALGFAPVHPGVADRRGMAAQAIVLQDLMCFRREWRYHLIVSAEFVPHVTQAGFGFVEKTFGKVAVGQMAFDTGELLVGA